jgi:hypothetical protein
MGWNLFKIQEMPHLRTSTSRCHSVFKVSSRQERRNGFVTTPNAIGSQTIGLPVLYPERCKAAY